MTRRNSAHVPAFIRDVRCLAMLTGEEQGGVREKERLYHLEENDFKKQDMSWYHNHAACVVRQSCVRACA